MRAEPCFAYEINTCQTSLRRLCPISLVQVIIHDVGQNGLAALASGHTCSLQFASVALSLSCHPPCDESQDGTCTHEARSDTKGYCVVRRISASKDY